MGDFKNVFKKLRLAAGLTQEQLAKRLGISRSRIGMYETGNREPDFETLELIADFFNVDVDYLIGRTQKTTVIPESNGYYFDPETAALAQQLKDNPDLRVLLDAGRDMTPDEMRALINLVKTMKGNN